MRVLFDQGTPVGILNSLPQHFVRTVRQQGWPLLNGELLRAAEDAGLDVLLTTDKNIADQQNLSGRRIAVVVLGRSRWKQIRAVLQQVASAVNTARPGSYTLIEIPDG
jgi:hypothetical protein